MTISHRALDVAFVVQGEGRGHLTQATALRDFLTEAGHRVTACFLGTSPHHRVPDYFAARFDGRVIPFTSPTLVPDPSTRAMSVARTAAYNARMFPRYVTTSLRLRDDLHRLRPDVVVNFFDHLAGPAHAFTWPGRGAARLALAHAYLLGHPGAAPPPPGLAGRLGLQWLSWWAALGCARPLALSMDPLPDTPSARVVPPLLRPGLEDLATRDDGYLLVYALNRGYARDVAHWHRGRPDVPVHCYVAGGAGTDLSGGPGFHVHDLDDVAFLNHLAACRAYVGTAGFESVCEAHYLGKPVLAVPVDRHYEQAFNAADIARVGIARVGSFDDLDDFWDAPPFPDASRVDAFRAWVKRAPEMLVDAVEDAARRRGPQPRKAPERRL